MIVNRLFKNASWLFMATIFAATIGFAQSLFTARLLGAQSFGVASLIISSVGLARQFFDFRSWQCVTKYMTEFLNAGQKRLALEAAGICYAVDILINTAVFAVILWKGAVLSAVFLHGADYSALFSIYAFGLLCASTNSASSGILRVFNKFSWFAWYIGIAAVFDFCLVVFLLVKGWGVRGIIIGHALGLVASAVLITVMAFRLVYTRIVPGIIHGSEVRLGKKRREILRFLFHTNLNETVNAFALHADILLLGYFRNPYEVGLYKLAKNILTIPSKFSAAIYSAVYPEIIKLIAQRARNELLEMIRWVTAMLFLSSIIFVIIILWLAPYLIIATAGEAFIPAAAILRVLAFSVITVPFLWQPSFILGAGRSGALVVLNLLSSAVLLASAYILIPLLGAKGAAFSVNLYSWFSVIAMTFFIRNIINHLGWDVEKSITAVSSFSGDATENPF